MKVSRFLPALLAVCFALAAIGGCSDQPTPPPRFQIDSEKASQEAMRLYDKNQDGTLDAKELEASPPLREMLNNLKARHAGHADSLTAADIKDRLDEWIKAPAILLPSVFMVSLDGRPLDGATVTFVPEPFLGSSYHTHHGVTNVSGSVVLDPELEKFPNEIYVGLYRISVSKEVNGKETIPARYNSPTTLGREVATDIPHSRENVMIRLTSK